MLRGLLKDIWSRRAPSAPGVVTQPKSVDDVENWRRQLIVRTFQLMHNIEQDNFDVDRYRNVPPDAFYFENHAAYFSLFLTYADSFFQARNLLADEKSKVLFDYLILFRILGHLHVRLPVDHAIWRSYQDTSSLWKTAKFPEADQSDALSLFSVPTADVPIAVQCWQGNAIATFLQNQYYFSRNNVSIAVAEGDYVVDAGACFGDTALRFAHITGSNGRIYSFDPIAKHCEIMRENCSINPGLASRIEIFQLGLSDHRNNVSSPVSNVINPGARISGDDFPTRKIDDLAFDGTFARVDFIKMDIEGSELAALVGAEATLRKWRPKLAISLYHRPEDMFAIPLWLNSLGCGYQFYLDHYSIHHEETVLYAQAEG